MIDVLFYGHDHGEIYSAAENSNVPVKNNLGGRHCTTQSRPTPLNRTSDNRTSIMDHLYPQKVRWSSG